ncbi:hypothetical protein Plec18170_006057 [Paecilomyces lecythidis]
MAACALASARVRDRAVVSKGTETHDRLLIPAETFYAAAENVLPSDLLQIQEFGFLRGCALLAIASIQDGKIDAMHKYIGIYFSIMSIYQWHDEEAWPNSLSRVEQEELRRLYWSIYTLDIYSSIVWNGCPHFQEAHARVEYPTGYEESGTEQVQHESIPHWILGWNFTTDLYRILEHAVGKLRTRRSQFNFMGDEPQNISFRGEEIIHRVNSRYNMLPSQFRDQKQATGDPSSDIYGFQAANIQATLALLQIVLFSLDGNSDVNKKCTVASNVLSTFRRVPTEFVRAISTPLIYHIAGIGFILGSVMEEPLSETSYQKVRELLLSMASLLESLEAFLHRSAGAEQQLRALIDRIDKYMSSGKEMRPISENQTQQIGPLDGASDPGNELSPQFQLPDELLQEWTWPYDISQAYLPFATCDLQWE